MSGRKENIMKNLYVRNQKDPEIGKTYLFNIITSNLIEEFNTLQVLFMLNDNGTLTLGDDSILYVKEYSLSNHEESDFIDMLRWCQEPGGYLAYYFDTDELSDACGECVIYEEEGELKLKITNIISNVNCPISNVDLLP